jgi:hypothetical protein
MQRTRLLRSLSSLSSLYQQTLTRYSLFDCSCCCAKIIIICLSTKEEWQHHSPVLSYANMKKSSLHSSITSTHSSSSESIPIPRPKDKSRHTDYSQIDMEHASKVAEWQDSQMYHRLLTGMFRSSQRLGHHPKIVRSLENLIQTQASPLSSLETSSNRTSDNQNEEWFTCNSCSGGGGDGDGDKKEQKGRRRVVSPDGSCSCQTTHAAPSSDPGFRTSTLEGPRSSLAQSGTAPKVLQQDSKPITDDDEEDDDDGIIFDLEI